MGDFLNSLEKDKPLYSLNVGEFELLMAELMQTNNINVIDRPQLTEPLKENYSIAELAKKLRVSEGTIHRYKNNQVIPFYKAGRTVYFKITEVEQALSSTQKKKGNKV